MIVKQARIRWKSKEEGGRNQPPTGEEPPPYATLVRFLNEPWPAPVAWTLVVHLVKLLDGPSDWLADVHFLVEHAPHDLIRDGASFQLYEGKRCVAEGHILQGHEGVEEE